jgi:hypothetical protein
MSEIILILYDTQLEPPGTIVVIVQCHIDLSVQVETINKFLDKQGSEYSFPLLSLVREKLKTCGHYGNSTTTHWYVVVLS